ncbi:ATP-binding protein [Actinomadura algeriensis]|uniref:Anti-sigma regulatory factor (Ser/Thr protein kinase) n=1 Tax=Actinomadura algeriensis TaxID=1679523 RepID=A0ABR9JU85_9ACTN|nr:ATP-binding protein [Actinomadura algeriensis]MBE1533969.1 anti-sigma regulatory factor (Ser/Thr protein kinase) [Actinomadura algeriensis]
MIHTTHTPPTWPEPMAMMVVPAEPESVKRVRDWVGAWFFDKERDTDVLDAARLLVSELFTNACRHAPPATNILVRVYHSDVGPTIEVWDRGDGRPAAKPLDETSESGRGLAMVELIAETWGVTPLPDGGKATYAVLATPSTTAAPTVRPSVAGHKPRR